MILNGTRLRNLLRFRKRKSPLISEAVTGKIDVRGYAV